MTCSFSGCDRRHYARGLCNSHYTQQARGVVLKALGPPRYHLNKRFCQFPGCGRKHATRGLCDTHDRQRRGGSGLTPIRGRDGHPLDWITRALATRSRDTGCWLDWPFACSRSGERTADAEDPFLRPHLTFDGHLVKAARLVLYLESGTWPDNALHHCDRPMCLNPGHLYDGSMQNNSQDAVRRGRHFTPFGQPADTC